MRRRANEASREAALWTTATINATILVAGEQPRNPCPFGMERIAADVEALHLGLGDPYASLVDPRVEGALDFEPCLGACRRDEVDDGGVVCERPAAPILRDAAEQTRGYLVPFRCAWRMVPDLDRKAGLVRELLQFHFPKAAHVSRLEPPQSAVIVSSPAFG